MIFFQYSLTQQVRDYFRNKRILIIEMIGEKNVERLCSCFNINPFSINEILYSSDIEYKSIEKIR